MESDAIRRRRAAAQRDGLAPYRPEGDTAGDARRRRTSGQLNLGVGAPAAAVARVEPAGRQLLSKLGGGAGGRAVDLGCGALGGSWILAAGVGFIPSGRVVYGTDARRESSERRSFISGRRKGSPNVELVVDDLFESKLQPQSYDLVHARYVIAPLGRGPEQVASYRRLVRPGGSLVLEEWTLGSWHFNPPAPASERLIRLLSRSSPPWVARRAEGFPICSERSV